MFICKVIGKVIATQKNEKLTGASVVLLSRASLSAKGEAVLSSEMLAAVDGIGCGEGNFVLVTSGANARFCCKDKEAPVDMAVVGILDSGFPEKT